MTDKELIQALRCCGYGDCTDCPAYKTPPECNISVTYEGAANRLEALVAENEHLREATKMVPQWVSVKEGVLEPGVRVLATDGRFVGEFYINKQGRWKRYNANHYEFSTTLDIRWWMPFPAPPSTEGVE